MITLGWWDAFVMQLTLTEKGVRCVLLGYPGGQKAYRLMDLETRKIFVSRDVEFKEYIFPFKQSSEEFNKLPHCIQMLPQLHCEEDVDHNAGTPIPTILEEAF